MRIFNLSGLNSPPLVAKVSISKNRYPLCLRRGASFHQTFINGSKMKKLMMNTRKAQKCLRLIILTSSVGVLMLATGCTHTRDINVVYTPLIQTRQLANRNEIQKVAVGNFIDARPNDELLHFGSGINIHSYTWKTQKNIPELVRGAFEDALLKTGFGVHKPNEIEKDSLFTITGKVLSYNFSYSPDVKHLTFQNITETASVTANVEVELLLHPKFSDPVTIIVKGEKRLFLYEPALRWSNDNYRNSNHLITIGPDNVIRTPERVKVNLTDQVRTEYTIKALDGAMHDCVMNFLDNKELLKLVSK